MLFDLSLSEVSTCFPQLKDFFFALVMICLFILLAFFFYLRERLDVSRDKSQLNFGVDQNIWTDPGTFFEIFFYFHTNMLMTKSNLLQLDQV